MGRTASILGFRASDGAESEVVGGTDAAGAWARARVNAGGGGASGREGRVRPRVLLGTARLRAKWADWAGGEAARLGRQGKQACAALAAADTVWLGRG